MSWIRVTVKDLETGDEEIVEIEDDYILITQGKCYLDKTQAYHNGTHVLTIKESLGRKRQPQLEDAAAPD